MNRTRLSPSASNHARWVASMVLPTPPLRLLITIVCISGPAAAFLSFLAVIAPLASQHAPIQVVPRAIARAAPLSARSAEEIAQREKADQPDKNGMVGKNGRAHV